MKKFYLSLALLALFATGVQAQTLLDEDFETSSTESYSRPVTKGSGWTTIDSYTGTNMSYKWSNTYGEKGVVDGSKHAAACDGALFESSTEGKGPREEILLSPELNLDNTYQLKFDWKVGPMASMDNSKYDLQVRVVENDDMANAITVFSIQDQNLLKESGVLTYPITTWDPHTSEIDLSYFKGKKVKLAFVYKMLYPIANIAYIDNVTVKQFTPPTQPVPVLSDNAYKFPAMYIGEKFYTTLFTLTNQGTNGLKVTGIDLPQGVTTTWDYKSVDLAKYESTRFQLAYTASLTSPVKGDVVVHTNGGDVTVALSAEKMVVPEGYQLESFNDYFPPAGWKNKGWSKNVRALEGDGSAYGTASYTDAYLVSPRLDLSKGGKLIFTYLNDFTSGDGSTYQTNDFRVDVSYNGGKTWTTKWTYDYTRGGMTNVDTLSVDLGTGTDSSYVRFVNTAVEYDSETGAGEFADIYVDRVLLPNVYGADGVPGAATLITPADSATQVLPKNITLSWGPAQFAEGYRLYVGSNDAADNLISNLDLGDKMSYTVLAADYSTTYKWKVVPYNSVGSATNVPVWQFTTQPDASVKDYPYVQDFTSGNIPTGWTLTPAASYNRNWYINSIYPYKFGAVTSNALTSGYLAGKNEQNSITTQEFTLPADKVIMASWVWTSVHPSDALVDPSDSKKKQNVEPNNGISAGYFQIYADGQWNDLTSISETGDDAAYWKSEQVNLSAYAGKTVQFRWVHKTFDNYYKDGGTSVAHFELEVSQADKATFNKTVWNAGKVNYNKSANSGEVFTLFNKGTNTLKIKSVTFTNPNFTSTLAAGDEIASGESKNFSLQFDALSSATSLTDAMTVTFESGYQVALPVSGTGLAANQLYYGFEDNKLDYLWKDDFTMIDADNTVNESFTYYLTSTEKNGEKYAYTQAWLNNPLTTAHDGVGVLLTGTPISGKADDWLISKPINATEGTTFDFYVRNLEQTNSVLPAGMNHVTVLVSTTDKASTASFNQTVLANQEVPYLEPNTWQHYTADLSSFAGKTIYVALRHTTEAEGVMEAFYDDFTFNNIGTASGVKTVTVINDYDDVQVFTIDGRMVTAGKGAQVLESLDKGLYIVRVAQGNTVQALRYMKK